MIRNVALGLIGLQSARRFIAASQVAKISSLVMLLSAVPYPFAPCIALAVTIPTVPVGNAGNAADTEVMTTDNTSGYGSVAYNYRIGTTEVTVSQYTEFLNAVAATDTFDLFDQAMTDDLNMGGIARTGSSGNYSYSVIGSPNRPVAYVDWGDAARFANWLHNGQPAGAQNARLCLRTLLGRTFAGSVE